jgi:aryl-alcohol dehydrogenase-like predicted oxidoreductase
MNYRRLGRTGLQVSELGYGSWGIGKQMWVGADDAESKKSLQAALDAGVNFIDTALVYGDGHSESLVGQVVRESAEQVYVATKIPPANYEWPARSGVAASEAFPGKWVRECTERSLSNLGLEAIDVQQFHVWSDEWVGQGDWAEAIDQLRSEGKIRYFGVSINDHQPANALRLVRSGLVDTVQVIYNIFDQSPEDELFPAVQQADVGVIVRVPFDEGSLTGSVTPGTVFPEGDWRNGYFGGNRKAQVWERVQAVAHELGRPVEGLAEVALRFCLSHPAVSTVIPGMRRTANVERNVAAAALGALPDAEVAKLHAHRWVRNFYQAAKPPW